MTILSDVDRLVFLMEEIAIIKSRILPEDCGHLYTTVNTLESRVEELKEKIKNETKATIRCIPFDENPEKLKCIHSGQPAQHEVIYAKAY